MSDNSITLLSTVLVAVLAFGLGAICTLIVIEEKAQKNGKIYLHNKTYYSTDSKDRVAENDESMPIKRKK